MAGYSKRVLRLPFAGLTDDDVNDPIWVAIRNPRLVPPDELVPEQSSGILPDGTAADPEAATNSMHLMFARLIVGWRAYDARQPVELDAAGNDITVQRLIPNTGPDCFTPENVAKLPMEIVNAIVREVEAASDFRTPQDHRTSKTST